MRLCRISEKKPLIIPYYGASRETRFLKVVWGLLQLAYFVYAKSESPGEVMRTCTCRLVGAKNIVRAHISRLVSLLVIQINSRCLFLTTGSKPLQVYRYIAVKRFTG